MFITALFKILLTDMQVTNVNEGYQVEYMDLTTDTNSIYEF